MAQAFPTDGDSSLDDFTHLSMDRSLSCGINGANSFMSKSQYGQVVFHDLCDVYPTGSDIKCHYSLTDNITAKVGDKIILFRVGWLTVSEYITYENVMIHEEGNEKTLQVTFSADSLPKDDIHLYQLCYLTCDQTVVGASIPFGFRKPHESEFVAVEDPSDPGLLVFKSRVTQLQEDMNKVAEERDSLCTQVQKLEIEMRTVKEELSRANAEYGKTLKENTELLMKINNIQEEKKILEEKVINNPLESKLVLMKDEMILMDEERNKIKLLLKEKINEIRVHEATIECLKQDRKHIDENLREYIRNNEGLVAEKQSLAEELVKLNLEHNNCALVKKNLQDELKCLSITVEDLQEQILAKEQLISAVCHSEGDDDKLKIALVQLEDEKRVLTASLANMEDYCKAYDKKIFLYKNEIENLKIQLQNVETNTAGISPEKYKDKIDSEPKADGNVQNIKLSLKNALVQKAELSSQVVQIKHEKEEMSKHLSDATEKIAALKSRIGVLEYELSAAKSQFKEEHGNGASALKVESFSQLSSVSKKLEETETEIGKFVDNIGIVEKFNRITSEKSLLEEQLEQDRKDKLSLQKKVEDLLLKNSKLFSDLYHEKMNHKKTKEMKGMLESSTTGEYVEVLQKVLDDADSEKVKLEGELQLLRKEKQILQNQLITHKKESVGKVSLEDAQALRAEISTLKEKLIKDSRLELENKIHTAGYQYEILFRTLKKKDALAAEQVWKMMIDKLYSDKRASICPICAMLFPSGCYAQFKRHIEQHT